MQLHSASTQPAVVGNHLTQRIYCHWNFLAIAVAIALQLQLHFLRSAGRNFVKYVLFYVHLIFKVRSQDLGMALK